MFIELYLNHIKSTLNYLYSEMFTYESYDVLHNDNIDDNVTDNEGEEYFMLHYLCWCRQLYFDTNE